MASRREAGLVWSSVCCALVAKYGHWRAQVPQASPSWPSSKGMTAFSLQSQLYKAGCTSRPWDEWGVPEVGFLGLEDCRWEASLGYMARLSQAKNDQEEKTSLHIFCCLTKNIRESKRKIFLLRHFIDPRKPRASYVDSWVKPGQAFSLAVIPFVEDWIPHPPF